MSSVTLSQHFEPVPRAALQPVDPDLARVAWRELGAMVDKLAAGEPYRLTRDELPAGHPLRRQGRGGDLLVLDGDELRAA